VLAVAKEAIVELATEFVAAVKVELVVVLVAAVVVVEVDSSVELVLDLVEVYLSPPALPVLVIDAVVDKSVAVGVMAVVLFVMLNYENVVVDDVTGPD
jgi:hypothetical protein